MNKAAVRRALTTLKKNNIIQKVILSKDNKVALIMFEVNSELIQPKKRVYIRKTKTKKDFITDGGMSS